MIGKNLFLISFQFILISKLNVKNDDGLKLSIALGYATSSDVEDISNIEKVYILADNHMYANKKEMKKSDA